MVSSGVWNTTKHHTQFLACTHCFFIVHKLQIPMFIIKLDDKDAFDVFTIHGYTYFPGMILHTSVSNLTTEYDN